MRFSSYFFTVLRERIFADIESDSSFGIEKGINVFYVNFSYNVPGHRSDQANYLKCQICWVRRCGNGSRSFRYKVVSIQVVSIPTQAVKLHKNFDYFK